MKEINESLKHIALANSYVMLLLRTSHNEAESNMLTQISDLLEKTVELLSAAASST